MMGCAKWCGYYKLSSSVSAQGTRRSAELPGKSTSGGGYYRLDLKGPPSHDIVHCHLQLQAKPLPAVSTQRRPLMLLLADGEAGSRPDPAERGGERARASEAVALSPPPAAPAPRVGDGERPPATRDAAAAATAGGAT